MAQNSFQKSSAKISAGLSTLTQGTKSIMVTKKCSEVYFYTTSTGYLSDVLQKEKKNTHTTFGRFAKCLNCEWKRLTQDIKLRECVHRLKSNWR